MGRLLDYLHFGIYNSVLFLNKRKKPNYRAVFVLSMCIFFNIICLVSFIFPIRSYYWIGIATWAVVYFLLIRFFYSVDSYRRMLRLKNQYPNEVKLKIVCSALLVFYIAGSILTLPIAIR